MSGKKKKIYNVDFDQLERRSYKSLNPFQKEVIDKMIEMGEEEEPQLSAAQLAKLDLVFAAMEELTDHQRKVLNMLFGLNDCEPCTEREVAEKLKIAQVSVHEIKGRAIQAIRKRVTLNDSAIKNIKNPKKSS